MTKNWTSPNYSRKRVRRAGESLRSKNSDEGTLRESLDVLGNWRLSHAYPMHAMLMFLRSRALKIDTEATTAQRLKRLASITSKLDRFQSMGLDRMQDIGGCRVILANQRYADSLKKSILSSRTRHVLHKQNDYVSEPKLSGYRGYHLIFKYAGTKSEYTGLFVEAQIRTRNQHAWATAVEIVGTFIGKSLKTGEGHEMWDEFFRLMGIEIAAYDGAGYPDNYNKDDSKRSLRKLIDELNVRAVLPALSATTNELEGYEKKNSKSAYYLMVLDTSSGGPQAHIRIWVFAKNYMEEAALEYAKLEQVHREDSRLDVVLVLSLIHI